MRSLKQFATITTASKCRCFSCTGAHDCIVNETFGGETHIKFTVLREGSRTWNRLEIQRVGFFDSPSFHWLGICLTSLTCSKLKHVGYACYSMLVYWAHSCYPQNPPKIYLCISRIYTSYRNILINHDKPGTFQDEII